MQIVRVSGKFKISWSEFHGNSELNQYSLLIRDIGTVVTTHVPMLASSFEKLEKEHQDTLAACLDNMYVVSLDDEKLKKCIETQAVSRYRNWKYKCHSHFLNHGPAIPLEFKLRHEQWRDLVEKEFLAPDKQAIRNCNKLDRTKNPKPIKHHSGPRPVYYWAEQLYKDGHLTPFVKASIDEYLQDDEDESTVKLCSRQLMTI